MISLLLITGNFAQPIMLRPLAFKILYTALMFLATLVISNLALPEAFGMISLLVLNASLFSLVTGLGTDSLIMHMVGKSKWNLQQAVYFATRTVALQLLIFLALEALSFSVWKVSLLSNDSGSYFFLLDLIYFLGLALTEKAIALLYSGHRTLRANLLMAIIAFIFLCSLLLWQIVERPAIHALILFFAMHSLVQGLALVLLFFAKEKWPGAVILNRRLVSFLALSSVVMITNVIQLLAYRIDFWLIKFFHSTYEVGLYAQASKFANLIWILPNIITQLLIPRFAFLSRGELLQHFRLLIFLNLFMAALTAGATWFFFQYFLDDAYAGGLPAFYLMLPGYTGWAAVIYFAGYFSWQGRFRLNLWGSAACFIIILLVDIWLIPRLSVNGAAIANSIAYLSIFIFYLVLMQHAGFRWQELLMLKKQDLKTWFSLLKREAA